MNMDKKMEKMFMRTLFFYCIYAVIFLSLFVKGTVHRLAHGGHSTAFSSVKTVTLNGLHFVHPCGRYDRFYGVTARIQRHQIRTARSGYKTDQSAGKGKHCT